MGAAAVLTRFVVTDLIETIELALTRRRPFRPIHLPIAPERHYQIQALYLAAFGVAEWLVVGGVAYVVLRVAGHPAEPSRVLDVAGLGMLIPMPALWSSDTLMMLTGHYRLPELAVTHASVQLWEGVVISLGLHSALHVPRCVALIAGLLAIASYIPAGARFVR